MLQINSIGKIIITISFLLFIFLSYTTVSGYFLVPSCNYFSTTVENTITYQNESEYGINDTWYHFDLWLRVSTVSKDGFIVGNDFDIFVIGKLRYRGIDIPDKKNITIVLSFTPIQPINSDGQIVKNLIIEAIKDEKNPDIYEFDFYQKDITYTVSGSHKIDPSVYHNFPGGSPGLSDFIFIDIESPHILTLLKLTKTIVILTYWVVFLSIVTIILNYFKKKETDKRSDNLNKLKETSKKNQRKKFLTEIFTLNEKQHFVEILLIVAGIMAAIDKSLFTINIFVLFAIFALIYIIWISIVKKRILKRNFNMVEKVLNWTFSAFVGASFSGLIASMGLIGGIYSGGSIDIMIVGWLFIYGILSILLIQVLGLKN